MANQLPAAQADQKPKPENAVVILHRDIDSVKGEIAKVLPSHIEPEKFTRVLKTITNENPGLLKADRRSLLNAAIKCASDGLVPDGREAAITTFRTKVKDAEGRETSIDKAQYMPMVYGIHKKLRQSGEISAIRANVVYQNDVFKYVLGDVESIVHEPVMANRGKAIAVYAIAVLKDGSIEREVMSYEEVEKVRSVSKSKDGGPWTTWWSEMARKTAIRRLSKRLPMSSELAQSLENDQTFEYEGAPSIVEPVREIEAEPERKPVAQIEQPSGRKKQTAKTAEQAKVVDTNVTAEPEEEKPAQQAAKVIDANPVGDTNEADEGEEGDDISPFDLTDDEEEN